MGWNHQLVLVCHLSDHWSQLFQKLHLQRKATMWSFKEDQELVFFLEGNGWKAIVANAFLPFVGCRLLMKFM